MESFVLSRSHMDGKWLCVCLFVGAGLSGLAVSALLRSRDGLAGPGRRGQTKSDKGAWARKQSRPRATHLTGRRNDSACPFRSSPCSPRPQKCMQVGRTALAE